MRRPTSRRSAFTLLELLIVFTIAVVLGCIALTSLSRARLASHEADAVAALRTVAVIETSWRMNDADGNGRADFWTGDWSGFNRVADAKGDPIGLISADLARADGAPANASGPGAGRPAITASLVNGAAAPHSGYFFRAMTSDEQVVPAPYSEGLVNPAKFGFTAWPAEPGSSGHHVLILTESGAIWAREMAGPGAGGPAPAGTTLLPNANGGQLSWPGPVMVTEKGEQFRLMQLDAMEKDPWKSVQ